MIPCKFLIDQGDGTSTEVKGSAFRIRIGSRMILFVVHKEDGINSSWFMVSHHASGLRVGPGFHRTSFFYAEDFAASYLKGQLRPYDNERLLTAFDKAVVLNPKLERVYA